MSVKKPKRIIIVGGGPAGILAAIELSKTHEVHLFEKGKTLGRKFLVAGKGGFNLTNRLVGAELSANYSPNFLFENALKHFDSSQTRSWLENLGIPTYVGSSGRVFPEKGIKPIQVLNALKERLFAQDTQVHFEHEFVDFTSKKIRFLHKGMLIESTYDSCVFALGGASWSVTGSDGDWLKIFKEKGVQTRPFEPSNCGLNCEFPEEFLKNHIGKPLKNIRISCQGSTVKGEAVVSSYGLEGNAVYPISKIVRNVLKQRKQVSIEVDLKPFNTELQLIRKVTPQTLPKNYAYLFKLTKTQMDFAKAHTDKETYLNAQMFAKALKKLTVPIQSLRSVEEAISTVGGIDSKELSSDFSLKKIPNIYCVGEMFDWDTVTGGYLLQGCFSSAFTAAKAIANPTPKRTLY
jgi:uncharacterized flavoprotein (TIGR03862 family)